MKYLNEKNLKGNKIKNVKEISVDEKILIDGNLAIHEGKKATQQEAEAGTADDKYMTPLLVAQAIAELAGSAGVIYTIFEGEEPPDDQLGENGDLYLMWEEIEEEE